MSSAIPIRKHLPSGLFWLLTYTALWALLSDGSGWGLGALFIVGATALAVALGLQPWTVRLIYLPGFCVFFIRALLHGGWDVARRTVTPNVRINPGWTHYEFTESDLTVRLLLSSIVGLLPGTLAARIEGDLVHMHLLDRRQNWQPTVIELEQQLSRLLGSRNRH